MNEENNSLVDFEKKLDSAKEILEKLMDPELTLDASVKSYKEGMQTLQDAQSILEKATLEFEKIQGRDA